MASWSRSEIGAVLRYNFTRGLSIGKYLEEITFALNNDCPHSTTIFRWNRGFQSGNFTLEDEGRKAAKELEKIAQEFSWSSSSEEDPFHASEEDSDFIPSENEESQEAHVRDDLLETDGEDGDAEDGDVEDDDLEDNVEAEGGRRPLTVERGGTS
ncbi:unnamed protein product [Acanthoscelides obtectus]|uniref:Uncharacterized protein n=1 Tax=Acanthoscelides obtectus TaxID=200917 RepID=A0A9P0LIB8_ACAOB|nr:unnamed protein product [Acanthoscelides obtectus]CAK1686353.1 hypothetical protein AOBTE_LOCUS35935 [Acanthoscelides obtectus]